MRRTMLFVLLIANLSASVAKADFTLDVDEDGEAKALTDGLLIIRYLFGFSGDALVNGATTAEAQRSTPEEIQAYLETNKEMLDIDGNGSVSALTDGLLIIRSLFGFSGEALTADAIDTAAQYQTAADIKLQISGILPPAPRVDFSIYLHESMPSEWREDFQSMWSTFELYLPAMKSSEHQNVRVFAWLNTVNSPYKDIIGEDLGGMGINSFWDETSQIWDHVMVLEFWPGDLQPRNPRTYSPVAHEYFHIFQITRANNLSGSPRWLTEGTATTFESVFVQNYFDMAYLNSDWIADQTVTNNPAIHETYDVKDPNYASSVFMVLVLTKELQKLGYSETEAFRAVFIDYWEMHGLVSDKDEAFKQVFEMTREAFYQILGTYDLDYGKVLPSKNLKISDVFQAETKK
jgi:hypothetical protein